MEYQPWIQPCHGEPELNIPGHVQLPDVVQGEDLNGVGHRHRLVVQEGGVVLHIVSLVQGDQSATGRPT